MTPDKKKLNQKDSIDSEASSDSAGEVSMDNDLNDSLPATDWSALKKKLVKVIQKKGVPEQDAEDLCQDILVIMLENPEKLKNKTPFFYGIKAATYKVINYFREVGKKRKEVNIQDDDKTYPELASKNLIAAELEEEKYFASDACLHKCLEKLSDGDAEIYIAYYLMNHGDEGRRKLAKNRKMKYGTLRQKVSRIGQKLEECIKKCMKEKGWV
jgi:RNA polymerase sigma factor (sigma-70 family)